MKPIKIAMWSGPRNLSTSTMRSFGEREDTVCIDEPFYAAYLLKTGLDHPLKEETLLSQENNAKKVAAYLSGPNPHNAPIWYQKHMCHHMIAGIPRHWMESCRHAFLIRHPARVIASFTAKHGEFSLEDTGLPLQVSLFDAVRATGSIPPVMDTTEMLVDPGRYLSALCAQLDIPFTKKMLRWKPGPRPEDGVWGVHWYANTWRSSGFEPKEVAPLPAVLPQYKPVLDAALPFYQELYAYRIKP